MKTRVTSILLVVLLCVLVWGVESERVNGEYMQKEFLEKGIRLEELVIRSGEKVEKGREIRIETPLCVEWVVFIGDSITRNLFAEYLSLFHPSSPSFSPNYDLFKGQRDFDYTFQSSSSSSSSSPPLPSFLDLSPNDNNNNNEGEGYPSTGRYRSELECEEGRKEWRVSFFWRPFVDNTTSFLLSLANDHEKKPNEIVCSVGSWDMLHINDLQSFSSSLAALRSSLLSLPFSSSSFLNIGPFYEPSLPSSKSNLSNPSALSFNSLLNLYLTNDPSITVIDKYQFLSLYLDHLNADGVHPSPLLTSFLLQIWLNSFPSSLSPSHLLVNTRNQPPLLPLPDHPLLDHAINNNNNNETNNNNNNNVNINVQGGAVNSPAKKAEGFIGKDPYLGALVGLFLLCVFFTRDPFLLSNFLLYLSSRYFH